MRMMAIDENEFAGDGNISNGGAAKGESSLCGEGLLVCAEEREVVEVGGEEVGGLAKSWVKRSAIQAEGTVTPCRGAMEQVWANFSMNVVENAALTLHEA